MSSAANSGDEADVTEPVAADVIADADVVADADGIVDADVIVVGGGPVGLAVAIEARLAGLTVILVEQRPGTIDKACGEGLMPGALPLLARLGVDPVGEPLRGVVYQQGALRAVHRFTGSGQVGAGEHSGAGERSAAGRGVRRTELHRVLGARADELGVRRITAKVTTLDAGPDVVSVSTFDGAVAVRGRYLLGCDGLHSTIARLAGLSETAAGASRSPGFSRARRYGVRQHYARAPWSDNIEVYFAARAEFYVTPVASDTVGLAMLAAKGTDFDEALATLPELAAKVAGIAAASSRRGAGPFHQRTRARTAGRVLLVGDASGYVDAITGEGLRLGFAQAHAAVRCIAADEPRRYERQWKRETRDFRVLTSALVVLATSPARRAIVPLAARFPRLFGAIVERLAR